jgi:NAD(P)-dependent dehydrogenase (short-subunit alcohol dehydrogenase family)
LNFPVISRKSFCKRSWLTYKTGQQVGSLQTCSSSLYSINNMPTTLRCEPKLFHKDLSKQVIIVTGANSGCGLETSRQLAKQGATVVLACRSQEKAEKAAVDVGGVFIAPLDLASLDSVRDFVKVFQEKYDRLDALVNNAGIMACPYAKTKDGFEMQFGCNHLAHFLLMHLLTPLLLKTAETTGKPSRFVGLSSCAATATTLGEGLEAVVDFDDLNWETREYNEGYAYQQSKLAICLHVMEAGRKYSSDKLISTSIHPGWVQSNLDVHVFAKTFGTGFFGKLAASIIKTLIYWKGDMITAVDGAQTSLHCLLEDADKMENGGFYSQFGIYVDEASRAGGWPMKLPNPNATPEAAAKLWVESEKLVGV